MSKISVAMEECPSEIEILKRRNVRFAGIL